jgi:2,3-bisphosphoglycerate-independent phosphoglycerate mutase
MTARPPLVLVVLDGWGLRAEKTANAIALARTPVYTELLDRYPHSSLVASGEAVGLPAGQMGNSEVGHMNMGAGRIVYQDLTRIDKSIADGELFTKPALAAAMDRCAGGTHALHFVGLVSDGGVHSHQRHLEALVVMAARRKVPRVFVHAITDGRDTSPTGGIRYVGELERVMARESTGRVATVSGRYYAMDRDKRWDRTARAYDAMTIGAGHHVTSAADAIQRSYAAGTTDEFLEPSVIVDGGGQAIGSLRDGDSVLFFNFRADRARQLTRALAFDDFDGFARKAHPKLSVTTMTVYDATFDLPAVFEPQTFSGNIADVLAAHGLTNLRLAETEKYAHVTYFFNCGEERPYPGEDRVLVPSPKVPTYDLKPEMSAEGITGTLVDDLNARRHDVVICNFANADMVGHTGRLEAAVKAVETLDECLGRIARAVRAAGGTLIVTADHGNAEMMWDPVLNAPHTAHTSNPVPVVLVNHTQGITLRAGGTLRDVAPTMLGILGLQKSKEMTGDDLRRL